MLPVGGRTLGGVEGDPGVALGGVVGVPGVALGGVDGAGVVRGAPVLHATRRRPRRRREGVLAFMGAGRGARPSGSAPFADVRDNRPL